MKIVQLLNALPSVVLTNQEKEFLESHSDSVSLSNLSEQEQWIAQNLVRKGVYSISNSDTLVKNTQ